MVPISYIVKETGMSYMEIFDCLYRGKEVRTIQLVHARLRNVDNTDFAEMIVPMLKGYRIPKTQLIECGMSEERLEAIISGNLKLSHCDKEFIVDVIKDHAIKEFDALSYFKARLESVDTLPEDQIISCKSPEECEKMIETKTLTESIKHFNPSYKGCHPFTELTKLDTSARLAYKSKNSNIDWDAIANILAIPQEMLMSFVKFEKGNNTVQLGIGDAIDVYLNSEDKIFDKEEYLKEYLNILPPAAVADCVTKDDCDSLLSSVGLPIPRG